MQPSKTKGFFEYVICLFILTSYVFYSTSYTCAAEEPLVTGSTPIPDGQMTASTIYHSGVPAHYARLNFNGAWCPSSSEYSSASMWIQVIKKLLFACKLKI